jgi:hypothetical protein
VRRSPNRLVGVVVGGFFLLLGIAGLFVPDGGLLLWVLPVALLQNLLHVLLGSALLLAALPGAKPARAANPIAGAAFLLFGLVGLFLIGTSLNVLALSALGNTLHFASAAVLLAVGLGAKELGAKEPGAEKLGAEKLGAEKTRATT